MNLNKRLLSVIAVVAACAMSHGCDVSTGNSCGDTFSGFSDAPPSFKVDMGQNGGAFDMRYETRSAHDQVIVMYEGELLFDSGCVAETRNVSLRYGPGRSNHLDVTIKPNCSGTPATSWQFHVGCPTKVPRPTSVEPARINR